MTFYFVEAGNTPCIRCGRIPRLDNGLLETIVTNAGRIWLVSVEAGNKPCTRCGRCCRETNVCDLRWVMKNHEEAHFSGQCDQLVFHEDSTTSCKVIKQAFDNTLDWDEASMWALCKHCECWVLVLFHWGREELKSPCCPKCGRRI